MRVRLNLNTKKSSERVVISTWEQVQIFQIIQAWTYIMKLESEKSINSIQEGAKTPPISFPPVSSTKTVTSHKNILTLSLTLLSHWCNVPRLYLVPVPNYWAWTKGTKERFFSSNPYKIELIIFSPIEMLLNIGHMTTSTV